MRANLFWLNDEQWAKIKPLIPTNRPDRKPQNNRRILSGIIYVLKTGCRWQDCPPEYGCCASCHTDRNFTLSIGETRYQSIPGHSRWGLALIVDLLSTQAIVAGFLRREPAPRQSSVRLRCPPAAPRHCEIAYLDQDRARPDR
jgi:transposase